MPVPGIPRSARGSSDRWTLVVAAVAALLLTTLAVLQYRWTGELSAAANERMRANLEESSRLLANDIDAPIAQLHASFQRAGRRTAAAGAWLAARDDPRRGRGGASEPFEVLLAGAVRDWRESAAFPDLLDKTWIVVADRRESTLDVSQLDEDGGRLQRDPGPDDLEELVRPVRAPGRRLPEARPDRLVVPVSARPPGGRPGPPATLIVASLDLSVLEQEMLPALIERHFGAGSPGEAPTYVVSVTDVSGAAPRRVYPEAGAPGHASAPRFGAADNAPGPEGARAARPRDTSAHPSESARAARRRDASAHPSEGARAARRRDASATPSEAADIEFRALRMRPFPERRDRRDGPDFRPLNRDDRRRFPFGERVGRGGAAEPDLPDGAWLVRIAHRRGSLEAATDAARRRNLYVSSGVLFLIGVGFALVLVSARRARALAAQQVDFVAGVSRELNTPLQAIRSAGENLRAGVVREPEDIRGYGELIDREGRRLMRLVEQALQWAGIGRVSGRKATAEIDLSELLRATVAESNWFVDENGVELEVGGLDDLPTVRGDRGALIRVFLNLLHNAVKYGRSADGIARVRVDASRDGGRQRVVVSVTDQGPGIPKAEQRRIFEPFVRGRAATESTLPGSGLGLSLARSTIEEHGGTIVVDSEPGRTTFRVSLPVNGP